VDLYIMMRSRMPKKKTSDTNSNLMWEDIKKWQEKIANSIRHRVRGSYNIQSQASVS